MWFVNRFSKLHISEFNNIKYVIQPQCGHVFCNDQKYRVSSRFFHSNETDASTRTEKDETTVNNEQAPKQSTKWMTKASNQQAKDSSSNNKFYFDADAEQLSPEQQLQKEELIRELTRKLSGPLADENGNVPTGDSRPIAIEVDGPSHFYSNSTKYTAYTKLKHRLLTKMGYKVLHVPFFEWRRLRGAREREEYMRAKLKEEPTEWLDPDDEAFYNKRIASLREQHNDVINTLKTSSS